MSYGIVEIPEKGRGIVATKDLKEEEILFTETPICSAQMSWGVKLGYLGRFKVPILMSSATGWKKTNKSK